MDNNNTQRLECTRCKVNLTMDKFKLKRDDTRQKQCIECNGKCTKYQQNNKCKHGKRKTDCRDCGGSAFCEHNRQKSSCKDCGGVSICEHDRLRSQCKDCGGGSICEHDRLRSQCKDCGGGSICEHDRLRSQCKDCGGSQICVHNIVKNLCRECDGASICEHNIRRCRCKVCDPGGYLKSLTSNRANLALKENKELHTQEYLGCDITTFRKHIEDQFEPGMTWENHGRGKGKWNIDHIVPVKFNNPTFEEEVERLSYLNNQPLWWEENIAKGNRYCG